MRCKSRLKLRYGDSTCCIGCIAGLCACLVLRYPKSRKELDPINSVDCHHSAPR